MPNMTDTNNISKIRIEVEKDKDDCYEGAVYLDNSLVCVHSRETLAELLIAIAFELTNNYKYED